MGANFSPLYANLAIGFWKTNHIHKNNPYAANIVFFGRYIDELIIIWDGALDLIIPFIEHCTSNNYGLSFTAVSNPSTMGFLDLELGHDEHIICAKNYTKPTAGNSYLHFNSCHLPKLIRTSPRVNFVASDKTTDDCSTRFVTTFHHKYKNMERIPSKHWYILQQHPHPHLYFQLVPELRTGGPLIWKIKLPLAN